MMAGLYAGSLNVRKQKRARPGEVAVKSLAPATGGDRVHPPFFPRTNLGNRPHVRSHPRPGLGMGQNSTPKKARGVQESSGEIGLPAGWEWHEM